jgi:EmrB/QacA subfamily drug resistance transporter
MDSTEIAQEGRSSQTNIKRILPLIVGVSLFMDQLDATIVNTAIPAMSYSLGVSALSLKAVMTSYILSLAVCITLSGWMADRWGSRRVFASAVGLFTVSSFLCGISASLEMLIGSRILQGMSAALMMPVGRLLIVRTFDKSELLKAMNFVIVPALIGPLLGPSIGGLIVHWFSWHMIFFINIPIGIAILCLVNNYVPQYQNDEKKAFDWLGFLMFGSGFGLLTWVLELAGDKSSDFVYTIFIGVIAFILIGSYVLYSKRVNPPLLNLNLFKLRTFRIAVLGGFFSRLGLGSMPFLLPFFYQVGLGFPAWKAGLLTIPMALAAIGMKVLSSTILANLGYKKVLLVNTTLIASTLFVYAWVEQQTPIELILLMNLLLGFLSSLQIASVNSMAFADISKKDSSMASTISSSMQQMTMHFGLTTGGLLTGFFLKNTESQISHHTIHAVHCSFIALAILTAFSSLWFRYLKADDGAQISGQR